MGETSDMLRHLIERRHHREQRLLRQNIVGIEKENIRRASGSETRIPRGAHAAVFLTNNDQPVVRDSRRHAGRRVGRAVIHDDELEVLEALAKDAVQRLLDKLFGIVGRDNDRHSGRRRAFGGACSVRRNATAPRGWRCAQ